MKRLIDIGGGYFAEEVVATLQAGTALAGKVGIDQVTANANQVVVKSITAGAAVIGKVIIRNAANSADIDPLAEGTFTGRIGEVDAAPTVNTIMDRLKTLATLLAGGLPAALGAGGGVKVDGSGTALPVSGSVTAAIDQTTQRTTNAVVNLARRNTGVLHRSAIAAVDKLSDFVDASVTIANEAGTQGLLNANTAYYMAAIPGNRWGPCKVNTNIDTATTTADATNTHVLACTIAQATGPNSSVAEWYDLFLSVDAAPKWVGRITEAQRATGGEILTLGTVTAGASAGVINIGCVGTGIQTSNAVFAQSNAYTPHVAAGITSVDCAGYETAHLHVRLNPTDLRSVPALTIIPFFQDQVSTDDWFQGQAQQVNILGALGQSLEQQFDIDVRGATAMRALIGSISGQGAAASVWVELS